MPERQEPEQNEEANILERIDRAWRKMLDHATPSVRNRLLAQFDMGGLTRLAELSPAVRREHLASLEEYLMEEIERAKTASNEENRLEDHLPESSSRPAWIPAAIALLLLIQTFVANPTPARAEETPVPPLKAPLKTEQESGVLGPVRFLPELDDNKMELPITPEEQQRAADFIKEFQSKLTADTLEKVLNGSELYLDPDYFSRQSPEQQEELRLMLLRELHEALNNDELREIAAAAITGIGKYRVSGRGKEWGLGFRVELRTADRQINHREIVSPDGRRVAITTPDCSIDLLLTGDTLQITRITLGAWRGFYSTAAESLP